LPSGQLAPLVLDHDGVLLTLAFSVDTLPDLWRYVSAMGRRLAENRSEVDTVHLIWELDTSAGRFVLLFVAGDLVDVMLHPVRPVGAKGGRRALKTLFRQLGGRSVLSAVPGLPQRAARFESCEQLLIEMATQEDESVAPAVLTGRTFDVSSEYDAVAGVPEQEYPTWFRVMSSTAPVTDVLQLVAGFKMPFSVAVSPGETREWLWGATPPVLFRFVVQDGQVLAAWSVREGWKGGQAVFSSLVSSDRPMFLFVSLWAEGVVWPDAEPLGKIDVLLMREVLSGRFIPGDPVAFRTPVSLVDAPVFAGVALPVSGLNAPAGEGSSQGRGGRPWWRRLVNVVSGGRFGTE